MLYRFVDCAIYDSNQEPATTVWINAPGASEAAARVLDCLALTWGVERDQVCINAAGTDEFEIERNSAQPREAGDRRLIETGSFGEYPTYWGGPALLYLGASDQDRLRAATASAREHARELHSEMVELARQARADGNERSADGYRWNAEDYDKFARGER